MAPAPMNKTALMKLCSRHFSRVVTKDGSVVMLRGLIILHDISSKLIDLLAMFQNYSDF